MRKKVDVRDVQIGMYIAELDRPWLETPFMFQGFELESKAALNKLQELCRYVWIETSQGLDYVPPKRGGAHAAIARMEQLANEDEEIKQIVRRLAAETRQPAGQRKPYADQTTFEEELGHAKEIEADMRNAVRESFQEIKRGKPVDLGLAGKVVGRMVDSIVRNPDALVCLSQLKEVSEYTALHSIRSCILALAFGRHLALSKDEMNVLGLGALLHDIGMVKVPEEILEKRGGLTEQEFRTMTQHVPWGLQVANESGGLPPGAAEVIAQHHERGDGGGYPYKRAQTAITPAGYIGAIVDVYDAVTSDHIYKTGLSAEEALKRMYEWREKDFSAHMIEEFIRCMGIFPIGSLVELSTGSIGVVITINRARRLKPKVALVLTAAMTPYSARIVTDLLEHTDGQGREIKISRVLPAGSHGINPMDHIVQL
jgi:HD-GYP domain-containing protein (c-di-GMP phosphodiesterase class II)